MSGEELKQSIKRSGLTMSDVARELGTTPQNVQARLGRKTIKIDFIQKIKEIIDRCAPPLPAEMEGAVNVSDLFALTKENIVRGRLEYDRAKTGRHYSILLHSEALRIIEKYKGEKKLLRFSEHFRNVDVATVMINKKLAKVRPGLTTYYARHTWASIAFNLGIQKDVVSLAPGHSSGVRVTDTYINADLSRVDEANRRVIDYVLYNKK